MKQRIIQVRLNDEERKILEDHSKKVGLPPTSFMRFIVLEFIRKEQLKGEIHGTTNK